MSCGGCSTDADVLIENLRPGSLARLGFDDEALRELNPDLVHLAITGYGPDGPAAERPGYDFVIQAVAGLMSITGDADADGGQPTKVGVAISDVVSPGCSPRSGSWPGCWRAGRTARSAGQRIDVSLLASTLAVLDQPGPERVHDRRIARPARATPIPNIVPYETFATSDGQIVVAVGSERQWPRFCAAIGAAELADDPRFATNGDRVAHRAELRPLLGERLAALSTGALVAAS